MNAALAAHRKQLDPRLVKKLRRLDVTWSVLRHSSVPFLDSVIDDVKSATEV